MAEYTDRELMVIAAGRQIRDIGRKKLNRYGPVEAKIHRAVDDSHTASA